MRQVGPEHGSAIARAAGQDQANVTATWLPKLRDRGFVRLDDEVPGLGRHGGGGKPALVWSLTGRGRELVAALSSPREARVVADQWSVTEILTYTGATYRMLDYWVRRGLLHPERSSPGSGVSRLWTATELKVARRMVVLVEAGLTVEAAERAARNGGVIAPGVRVVFPAQLNPEPPGQIETVALRGVA